METDGAGVRGFGADDNVTTVAAFPDADAALAEYLCNLDVVQQCTVALLVVLLDGSDTPELLGEFVETLLIGFASKGVVHVCPFVVLTFGSMQQVLSGGAYTTQVLEPEFGMLLFVVGSFQEEGGDLFVTVLLGDRGKVGVLVACHTFSSKGSFEVLLCLCASIFVGGGCLCLDSDLHEVRCRVFADGANEVVWQFLAHILIAADAATPNGLALSSLSYRLWLGFDVGLIIIIGGRRYVGKHFHLCDKTDEEHVCAEVDGLLHIGRDEGVGATSDGESTVADTSAVSKVGKLIDRASTLETEVLEQFEVGSLAVKRPERWMSSVVKLPLLRATEMRLGCAVTCATVLLMQPLSCPLSQVVMTNRPYWMLKRGLLIIISVFYERKDI